MGRRGGGRRDGDAGVAAGRGGGDGGVPGRGRGLETEGVRSRSGGGRPGGNGEGLRGQKRALGLGLGGSSEGLEGGVADGVGGVEGLAEVLQFLEERLAIGAAGVGGGGGVAAAGLGQAVGADEEGVARRPGLDGGELAGEGEGGVLGPVPVAVRVQVGCDEAGPGGPGVVEGRAAAFDGGRNLADGPRLGFTEPRSQSRGEARRGKEGRGGAALPLPSSAIRRKTEGWNVREEARMWRGRPLGAGRGFFQLGQLG